MLPLLLLLVIAGIAAAMGGRVLRICAPLDLGPGEELLCGSAVGLGVLSYATLALAVCGLLYRDALIGLLIGAAVFAGLEARRSARLVAAIAAKIRWPRQTTSRIVLLLLVFAIALNLLGALAPISSADALSYHFAAPKIWLQKRHLDNITWDWHAHQPMTVEMLYLLGMGVQSDILGNLFHWWFGVLLVLWIAVLCRWLVREADGLLAAGIFYISALVAWESTSGLVELGLALFSCAAVHAFLRWIEGRNTGWLVLCGVFSGLATGCKITGGFVFVLLAGMTAFSVVKRGRAEAFRVLALLCSVYAIVALPWFAVTWAQTGDPLYPFLSLSRHPGIAQELRVTDQFYGYGRSLGDFLKLPLRLTFQGAGFDRGEFLGPLYLAFLPFALPSIRKNRAAALLAVFAAGFLILWFMGTRQTRFLFPMLPVAAVLCAVGVSCALSLSVSVRSTAWAIVLLVLGWNGMVTAFYNSQFIPVVLGRETVSNFLSRKTWFYPDIAWMNHNLPPGSRVLMLSNMGYYMDRDYVRWQDEPAPGLVATELRADRISDVYCPDVSDAECQMIIASVPCTMEEHRQATWILHRTLGTLSGATQHTSAVLHLVK